MAALLYHVYRFFRLATEWSVCTCFPKVYFLWPLSHSLKHLNHIYTYLHRTFCTSHILFFSLPFRILYTQAETETTWHSSGMSASYIVQINIGDTVSSWGEPEWVTKRPTCKHVSDHTCPTGACSHYSYVCSNRELAEEALLCMRGLACCSHLPEANFTNVHFA